MIETVNGIAYEVSEKYSNKDMTGWDLSDRTDMSGLVIHGFCLSNEKPDANVLPSDLRGVTFLACNLDNVVIPDGNILINCSNRRFQVQTDGDDWVVNQELEPLEPLNKKHYQMMGKSIDPADLPEVYLIERVLAKKIYDKRFEDGLSCTEIEFRELPEIISQETIYSQVISSSEEELPFDSEYQKLGSDQNGLNIYDGDITFVTIRGRGWLNRLQGL